MVCAYTLRETLTQHDGKSNALANREEMADFADPAAVAAMLDHWRAQRTRCHRLPRSCKPEETNTAYSTLFARSRLHKEEIDLLREIAKQMLLRK
jgi:tRNA/rRNA methyltransferase